MDIVCYSHLRWNFVFQRPQHVLTGLSRSHRIFYVEEPVYGNPANKLQVDQVAQKIWVVRPHIAGESNCYDTLKIQSAQINQLFHDFKVDNYIAWYYSPMFVPVTRHLTATITVFDCMDELSAFKFAPPELKQLESELLEKADIVFTGGHSLYQAKKEKHNNIHLFPSSIDKSHFARARENKADPADQADIPYPRIGFFGVIDERFDVELIRDVADLRPDWQIVLIGPVVKIDPASLPQRNNIHYLGQKSYAELPDYLSGWQLAMIPFALNESTRFISPTKTPEYLAAGVPVLSSAIKDVIHPYGELGLVNIFYNTEDFIASATRNLNTKNRADWLRNVDQFLQGNSWELTCNQMHQLIEAQLVTPLNHKSKEVSHV